MQILFIVAQGFQESFRGEDTKAYWIRKNMWDSTRGCGNVGGRLGGDKLKRASFVCENLKCEMPQHVQGTDSCLMCLEHRIWSGKACLGTRPRDGQEPEHEKCCLHVFVFHPVHYGSLQDRNIVGITPCTYVHIWYFRPITHLHFCSVNLWRFLFFKLGK